MIGSSSDAPNTRPDAASTRSSNDKVASIAVIGAGLAGLRSVSALRAAGFSGRLTIFGAEPHRPYDRPGLSKELLTRREPLWLEPDLGIDLDSLATTHFGEPVTKVSHDGFRYTLTTESRTTIADAVVVATGASPAVPPGLSGHSLRTLEDAQALRPALSPGARVVIVGAGWIGCEVASVAADAGCDVTLVEGEATPLATLGNLVGALVLDWLAEARVRFLPNTRVAAVTGGTRVHTATESIEADAVLIALGAQPDLRWLADTVPPDRLDASGHLPVDSGHRALGGPRFLYGVGDCAARRSRRFGVIPGGHWDGALRDPEAMAVALLADIEAAAPDRATTASSPVEDPAPYVFSTQFGHTLALFGHPKPSDEALLHPVTEAGTMISWHCETSGGPRLTARLIIDLPRAVSRTRKLFRTSHDLPPAGDTAP